MHLSADETTMPRLHLVGTLTLVLVIILALAAFYTWRNEREQRTSFERVAHVITQQQQERLTTEMQSAVGYMEFLRQRTEQVLRRSLVEQVDAAMQIAQAIHARESKHRPPEQVRQLIIEALRPVRFFDGRGYIQDELARLNHFFRDFRANKIKAIDPGLFDQLFRLQDFRDLAGYHVGVDVVGLAVFADADRGDNRNEGAGFKVADQRRVDLRDVANHADVDQVFVVIPVVQQKLFSVDHVAILAG